MKKYNLTNIINASSEHFFYIIAIILSSGIHFLYSMIVKIYVDPLEYGIYSTCILLQTYLAYLQLGTLNAFNRDYPQLIGAKKHDEAKKYRDTVFTFLISIFIFAILMVGSIMYIVNSTTNIDKRYINGYTLCSIIIALTAIENFGNYRRRIDGGFKFTSYITLLELLSVPIGLLLVKRVGYYSIYFTSIIAMLIGVVAYTKKSYADIKLGIDKRLLKEILISGLPLLINGLIWTVVNSIDKFVILGFINTKALGIYSVAQNAFSYMILIPSAMSQLFYVKMGKKYGETGDIKLLCGISLKYTSLLTMITSLLALVAFYFLPMLIKWVMPQYVNGIYSAQILIVGLSIYAATMVNGNILTILKRNGAILRNSVYMCLLNVICSVLLVIFTGAQIENVALGTASAYALSSFITVYQIHKYTGCTALSLLKASIFPILITVLPGVVIYNTGMNKIIGLVLSLIIVVSIYWVLYKKNLNGFFKRG